MHEKLYYEYLATPIGVLTIKADDNYLLEVSYDIEDISPAIAIENGITNKCKFQLTEYFAGKRQVFDLPLKFNGTDFQEKILHSLLQIPYGHTISYKQQSVMINKPLAMRAAGAANGRNKFTIIVSMTDTYSCLFKSRTKTLLTLS